MLEKCEDDDDVCTEVLGGGHDQGNSSVVSQHKTDWQIELPDAIWTS